MREKFARRAIELVRRAFAAGFGKDPVQKMGSMVGEPIDHVRKDKDLDAVRGLPEYRELIDQLTREAPTRGHR